MAAGAGNGIQNEEERPAVGASAFHDGLPELAHSSDALALCAQPGLQPGWRDAGSRQCTGQGFALSSASLPQHLNCHSQIGQLEGAQHGVKPLALFAQGDVPVQPNTGYGLLTMMR